MSNPPSRQEAPPWLSPFWSSLAKLAIDLWTTVVTAAHPWPPGLGPSLGADTGKRLAQLQLPDASLAYTTRYS